MDILTGLLWLTLNVYHEARSEEDLTQIAIAHVTLNRARNRNKPIKEVVLAPKQFSWTHLKANWVPEEPKAFLQCLNNTLIALKGFDFTQGATHYHRMDIKPWWAKSYHHVADFGLHRFYN